VKVTRWGFQKYTRQMSGQTYALKDISAPPQNKTATSCPVARAAPRHDHTKPPATTHPPRRADHRQATRLRCARHSQQRPPVARWPLDCPCAPPPRTRSRRCVLGVWTGSDRPLLLGHSKSGESGNLAELLRRDPTMERFGPSKSGEAINSRTLLLSTARRHHRSCPRESAHVLTGDRQTGFALRMTPPHTSLAKLLHVYLSINRIFFSYHLQYNLK
jgi:hypothetical protein